MVKKLLEVFKKKKCKNLVKENLEETEELKRKGDKFCVKWKWYDSRFNSWIDQQDII